MFVIEDLTMKRIGKVKTGYDELLAYLRSLPFEKDVSRYVSERQVCWLKWKVNLGSGKVSKGVEVTEKFQKFGDRVLPGWDIGLVTVGNGIAAHRDHSYGDREAVVVNLGECEFQCGDEKLKLKNGDIVKFNCKQIHSVKADSDRRVSIVLWRWSRKYKGLVQ